MTGLLAGVEIEAGTVAVLIGAIAVLAGGFVKLIDLVVWFVRERREKTAGKRKKADPGDCQLTPERVKLLDRMFDLLSAVDPNTELPRWYSPTDWKERMDSRDSDHAAHTSKLDEIRTEHTQCNKAQAALIKQLTSENKSLKDRVDQLQDGWREEVRELMDRLIRHHEKVAAGFERGLNGHGSHRLPSEEEEEESYEDEDEEEDE